MPADIAALWGCIFAGPFAWALDLTVSYALVPWTCGGGPTIVGHLVSLLALAIIAAGGYLGWREMRFSSATPAIDAWTNHRPQFMALLGLFSCALFALVVLAGAIPRWVLDACQS